MANDGPSLSYHDQNYPVYRSRLQTKYRCFSRLLVWFCFFRHRIQVSLETIDTMQLKPFPLPSPGVTRWEMISCSWEYSWDYNASVNFEDYKLYFFFSKTWTSLIAPAISSKFPSFFTIIYISRNSALLLIYIIHIHIYTLYIKHIVQLRWVELKCELRPVF